jgi:hypothetical protein
MFLYIKVVECQAFCITFVGVYVYVLLLSAKKRRIWNKKMEKNLQWCYNVQYEFQKRVYQIQNKNTIKYWRCIRKRKIAVKRKQRINIGCNNIWKKRMWIGKWSWQDKKLQNDFKK